MHFISPFLLFTTSRSLYLSLSLSLSISTKRIECVLGIINYSLSYCMDINLFCFMLLHNILLITKFGIFRASSKLLFIFIFIISLNVKNSLFQNVIIEMTEVIEYLKHQYSFSSVMRKLVSYLLTLTITTNERKLTFKTSSFVVIITLSKPDRTI